MPFYFALLAVSNLSAGTPIVSVPHMFATLRSRAVADDLTGMMVFDGAGFCLYLEGDRDAVMRCHDTAGLDSRQTELEAVCHGITEVRRFPDFRSGYAGAEGPPASEQLRSLDGSAALRRFMELATDFDLET